MKVTSLEEFVESSRANLALERAAEEEQQSSLLGSRSRRELEQLGVGLGKLHVASVRTGFGGRKVLALTAADPTKSLPSHRFSNGDTVDISPSGDHRNVLYSGIVARVSEAELTVAVDTSGAYIAESETANRTFFILKTVNDVTFRRLSACLDNLAKLEDWPGRNVGELLFGQIEFPSEPNWKSEAEPPWVNSDLNEWQKTAVRVGLRSELPFSVIHGPPGTGKTSTIVELVKQLVHKQGKRVLVCGPSNVSVDNVLSRLVEGPSGVCAALRLGHPARTAVDLRPFSLDARLDASDQAPLIADVRREMDTIRKEKGGPAYGKRSELGDLRKELKKREKQGLESVLRSASVVAATLTSASPDGPLKTLRRLGISFDVVVVDECGQSLEVACWIALLQGARAVVAGDDCQLPPTILSHKAAQTALSVSLMGRARAELGPSGWWLRLLRTQYRMAAPISDWASAALYNGQLQPHHSVAERRLGDLVSAEAAEVEGLDTSSAMVWVDTDGCHMDELTTEDQDSKANPGEVKLMYLYVRSLIRAGLTPAQISIISPYNLQVELLRCHLRSEWADLSIRSVDGFQGQENEVVLISLVRSNKKGVVGFLSEDRRLNVAVTRARRQVVLVGDSGTLSAHAFLRDLHAFVAQRGSVRSAAEYQEQLDELTFELDTTALVDVQSDTSAEKKPLKASAPTSKAASSKPKSTVPKTQPKKGSTITADAAGVEKPSPADLRTAWESELRDRVEAFEGRASQSRLEFPPSLGPHQRAFLHELAELKGLHHSSTGEGSERCIVLAKSEKGDATQEATLSPIVTAAVTKAPRVPASTASLPAKKKSKKKKHTETAAVEEDIDELIASFGAEEKCCKFDKCKRIITLMGQRCSFCARTFCLAHAQAELSLCEVHGCGDAARSAGRKAARAAGAGLRAPPPLKEDKRAALQSKLQKKTGELAKARAPAKPKDS